MASKRTYLETHPWIQFGINLNKADYKIWLLLGQVQAMCEYITGVPLLPDEAQNLYLIYLAKGVLATTAIEGNTLSEEEVLQQVKGQLELPLSKEYLGQEVKNIIDASNLIWPNILDGKSSKLTVEDVKAYNKLVLRDLPADEDVRPGELRNHSVVVGNYRGAPPEDLDYLLTETVSWLNKETAVPEGYELALEVIKAILIHVYIAWIHPFGDGNGRTARMLEFQILLSAGVPQAASHLLSNHYNQTRSEYYRQLDITNKSDEGIFSFVEYALQGFVDGLQEQKQTIRQQQLKVHWINHVHRLFANQEGKTALRRRRLALDLSGKGEPFSNEIVPSDEVRYVSTRISEAYAGMTERTVERDLKELESLNLVELNKNGIRVKWETMQAFMVPAKVVK